MAPCVSEGTLLAFIGAQHDAALVGVEWLSDLPAPPALRWSGFLIALGESVPLPRLVAWALELRAARPFVPLGIVGYLGTSELDMLFALARVGLRFESVINERAPSTIHTVSNAVAALREASVERDVLQSWLVRWKGPAHQLEGVLVQIIAHGVRGGKTKSLRVMDTSGRNLSRSTLQRLLRKAGLPAPGHLLRDARLTGAGLRESRGVNATDASLAAGFSSRDSRRRAQQRRKHG